MTAADAGGKGWSDLLAEGRLSKFALICLGVWLNAADALVTATIMPSVGADLGGYAYFSWSVAGFLVGAILAGASAGRVSEIFGLRSATVLSGLLTAFGCMMSAAAPEIFTFLAGRMLQGLGTGWISGFSMVAIALLFPERHLARVFATVSGVWGVATLLGPLVGGLYAEAGDWRGVFWLFAVQAAGFSAAAAGLLRGAQSRREGARVPWLQLGALAIGVGAIAVADLAARTWISLALIGGGFVVLLFVLQIDARARIRLLPREATQLGTVVGSGYASMFLLTAASMGLAIYGPPILQTLRGYSPLWAGYVIGVESLAWTAAAFLVTGPLEKFDALWVRAGALCLLASLVVLPWALAEQPLAWVLLGAILLGVAFGFSWSFISQRIMAVRQTGAAAGAALSGAAANLVGFSAGLDAASAKAASVTVFVIAIPFAVAGAWAAFRLTREG